MDQSIYTIFQKFEVPKIYFLITSDSKYFYNIRKNK